MHVCAGKSTLLDVLAGRKSVGRVEGSLLFNGMERSPIVSQSLAYVMQASVVCWYYVCSTLLGFDSVMFLGLSDVSINILIPTG